MARRRSSTTTAFSARTATRVVGVAGAAFLAVIASSLGLLTPLENAMLFALTPARVALSTVADPVDDFFSNFGQFGELQRENERLRAENEKLSVDVARRREFEATYNDLAKLLDVKSNRPDDRFLAASVVSRSSARYQQAVAINRGKGDGIVEGMVVLAPGGSVVGRVTSVLPDFAWVTLIADPTSKIPALVEEGRFDGILTGGADSRMRLEMLPQGSTIKPGDIVVTSGLEGELPKGLPLGRVIEVGGSDQDLFPAVFVEPLTTLRNLENVVVLTSFRPGGVPAYPGPNARSSAAPSTGAPAPADGKRAAESALPGGAR